MKTYIEPERSLWKPLIKRPSLKTNVLVELVEEVFETVESFGDKALKDYTVKFDKADLSDLRVSEHEMDLAKDRVDQKLKTAISVAAQNVRKFHKTQYPSLGAVTTTEGIECWQECRPIEKIGIYIPGGTAPLFSTVLMLAIPAIIAGCKEVVLCSPPDNKGEINPAILYTAQLVGVKTIFKLGGIQAIAAMSLGTESVPKVLKIFGPGNQYVTAAKMFALQRGVAIDMPAGPSELLVVADETANVEFIASDLLSQAEHGEDSQVIAVLSEEMMVEGLKTAIDRQLKQLPRNQIALKALANSRCIVLNNITDRIDFVNQYAPEHLIICDKKESYFLANVQSAGSVFLGNYTPESAGDYASGTNHTLPTNGFAAMYSGVNIDAYLKKITVQKISRQGLMNIGNTIEVMAEAEQLIAHKNAVSIRLKSIKL